MPISDAITDVITDVVTDVIGTGGEPPINYYPNAEWAGGYPPTGHNLAFNTVEGRMLDNGDGTFNFETNFNEGFGRNVFQWSLSTATLEVGKRYRLSYTVQKLNVTNYVAALNVANLQNVVVHNSNTVVEGLTTSAVFAEFTPSLGYDATVRIGCGTTANNTAHMIYRKPSIIEV